MGHRSECEKKEWDLRIGGSNGQRGGLYHSTKDAIKSKMDGQEVCAWTKLPYQPRSICGIRCDVNCAVTRYDSTTRGSNRRLRSGYPSPCPSLLAKLNGNGSQKSIRCQIVVKYRGLLGPIVWLHGVDSKATQRQSFVVVFY